MFTVRVQEGNTRVWYYKADSLNSAKQLVEFLSRIPNIHAEVL